MNGVIPVDDVDEMCFRWTKCNRCATIDHGDQCSPETVKYRFSVRGNDDIICQGIPTDPITLFRRKMSITKWT